MTIALRQGWTLRFPWLTRRDSAERGEAVNPDTITIEILPEDITGAVQVSPSTCVVARALNRQYGGHWIVGAYTATGLGALGGIRRQINLTPAVTEYIRHFDMWNRARPQKFKVDRSQTRGLDAPR